MPLPVKTQPQSQPQPQQQQVPIPVENPQPPQLPQLPQLPQQLVDNNLICVYCLQTIKEKQKAYPVGMANIKNYICGVSFNCPPAETQYYYVLSLCTVVY